MWQSDADPQLLTKIKNPELMLLENVLVEAENASIIFRFHNTALNIDH